MKKLNNYLVEHNPDFLLACQVHYYTLIRPNELSNIRLNDISLKEQTIFVSKDISKNRKDGKVTLPAIVIRHMIEGIYSAIREIATCLGETSSLA